MDGFYDVGPLTGQLVVLEPLGIEHVPGLVAAAQAGRDRYALTGVPADEAEAREYVARTIAGRDTNSVLAFATYSRRTERVVGSTRFCNFEHWRWQDKHRRRAAEIPDAVEIGGTWLAQDAQRTGVNREAKLLMLRVAFERWAVHRVRLRTDARNERSRAAIAALGAHFDGVLRAETAGYDGAIRDSATYSILHSEWPTIRETIEASLSRRRGSVEPLAAGK
ncbi:GNAT family protein [Streptomyces sp. NPDC032198]|uniref:GNAT family N-acetyltransferase n=1 Tax=unclassified Streptomyces TaxID=2593676 RepID=UPI0033EB5750